MITVSEGFFKLIGILMTFFEELEKRQTFQTFFNSIKLNEL